MELGTLDHDYTWHENQWAGDSKLSVHFFQDVLPDPVASAAAGYRKFRDVEMVTIMVPGDKNNVVTREVRSDDRERFAKHYERFKAGVVEQASGYPLSEWPAMSRAMATELKYLGFHTVEQVANAADGVLGKYPGLREVSARAKNWLLAQEGAAPIEKLQSQVEQLQAQLAALQAAAPATKAAAPAPAAKAA